MHNSVVTELEEALRYSLIRMDDSYSDSLVSTIEDNARTVVRYASSVPLLLFSFITRSAALVAECVQSAGSIMFPEYLMVTVFISATYAKADSFIFRLAIPCREQITHKVTGNYDCTFIYESLAALLTIVDSQCIL